MMLVLTRKVGESVVIGDGHNHVTVTVQSIQGGAVRLGFTSHGVDFSDLPIDRQEVYDAIEAENQGVVQTPEAEYRAELELCCDWHGKACLAGTVCCTECPHCRGFRRG